MERFFGTIVALLVQHTFAVLFIIVLVGVAAEKYRSMRADRIGRSRADFEATSKVLNLGVAVREFRAGDMLHAGQQLDDYETWDYPFCWYEGQWVWSTAEGNSARDYAMAFRTEADAARHYLRLKELPVRDD